MAAVGGAAGAGISIVRSLESGVDTATAISTGAAIVCGWCAIISERTAGQRNAQATALEVELVRSNLAMPFPPQTPCHRPAHLIQ